MSGPRGASRQEPLGVGCPRQAKHAAPVQPEGVRTHWVAEVREGGVDKCRRDIIFTG